MSNIFIFHVSFSFLAEFLYWDLTFIAGKLISIFSAFYIRTSVACSVAIISDSSAFSIAVKCYFCCIANCGAQFRGPFVNYVGTLG